MTVAPDAILAHVAHRPWPLPERRWIMRQTWSDLLFAHWPVPVEALQPLLPDALLPDAFGGTGWVGIVPFRMSGVRLRGLPAIPGASAFPELNVRTYVRPRAARGVLPRPGVWFFSLDAVSPIAVRVARAWFRLPYFDADMTCRDDGAGAVDYVSRRTHPGAPRAELALRYRPDGDVVLAAPGSLDAWLTERYCLYARGRGGDLVVGEVHHERWPLQPARAQIERNTMAAAAGIDLPPDPPRLHFARRLDVLLWAPRRLEP